MITERQRRNLSKYTDQELTSRIDEILDYWTLLEEERHLRELGSRPYDERGRKK